MQPSSLHALLIGFQDQDNLGLRYLTAAVQQAGFTAEIVTYQSEPAPLIRQVREKRPSVVGFSLIFQYMAPDFARVIAAMREAGVDAHITMAATIPASITRKFWSEYRGLTRSCDTRERRHSWSFFKKRNREKTGVPYQASLTAARRV